MVLEVRSQKPEQHHHPVAVDNEMIWMWDLFLIEKYFSFGTKYKACMFRVQRGCDFLSNVSENYNVKTHLGSLCVSLLFICPYYYIICSYLSQRLTHTFNFVVTILLFSCHSEDTRLNGTWTALI